MSLLLSFRKYEVSILLLKLFLTRVFRFLSSLRPLKIAYNLQTFVIPISRLKSKNQFRIRTELASLFHFSFPNIFLSDGCTHQSLLVAKKSPNNPHLIREIRRLLLTQYMEHHKDAREFPHELVGECLSKYPVVQLGNCSV